MKDMKKDERSAQLSEKDKLSELDMLLSLYDIYKDLLTSKQRLYFEEYYFNDLSLFEIAENYKVSRNAVFLSIKSVKNSLDNFENILKIKEKEEEIDNLIKYISENNFDKDLLDKVKKIKR